MLRTPTDAPACSPEGFDAMLTTLNVQQARHKASSKRPTATRVTVWRITARGSLPNQPNVDRKVEVGPGTVGGEDLSRGAADGKSQAASVAQR